MLRLTVLDAASRIDHLGRDIRLVIAEAHDQELLFREFARQPLHKVSVILRAHFLPAQIFVDLDVVAGIAPAGRQVRAIARVPGKMIGDGVNEQEERLSAALALHQAQGLVVKKMVGLDIARAHFLGIDHAPDAGRVLVGARGEERSRRGIQAEGLVAATPQRLRQAALDAVGRDARDKELHVSEGARRQSRQHVVFGEPGRPAGAFHEERARLAVDGAELVLVAGRHFHSRQGRDVEARIRRAP